MRIAVGASADPTEKRLHGSRITSRVAVAPTGTILRVPLRETVTDYDGIGRAGEERQALQPRRTMMTKRAVAWLPLVSTAEQVTFVRPTRKRAPDRGRQAARKGPSRSSTAVTR
jgi:hypothetical protein